MSYLPNDNWNPGDKITTLNGDDMVMGIFNFFKKNSFVPRPFFENKTKEEFQEWFRNVPEWNTLDSGITDSLIDRMLGDPYFELFMFTSMELNLIKEYIPLRQFVGKEYGNVAIYSKIANSLFQKGLANFRKAEEIKQLGFPDGSVGNKRFNEFKTYYKNSMDSFESAIHVEPDFLMPYPFLAKLKLMVNRHNEAFEFCKQGLERIDQMKKIPFPHDMKKGTEEIESVLKELALSK